MWRADDSARPGVHRHAGARPRRRSCRRSPGRSGRRTAWRCPTRRASSRRRSPRSAAPPAALPPTWSTKAAARSAGARALQVEGADFELGDGDVVIAAITSCTNTSNPSVLIGAGLLAKKAHENGPEAEALGEDLARAGLAGGHRLSREGRAAGGSRRARLQPRRLWLHHLHRQFRPAARGDLRGDRRERPRRLLGALRQPQLRGPREPGRAGQLSRLAAAGRRLCARRLAARRHHHASRSATTDDGKPVYLKDIWPTLGGDRRHRSAR